MDKIGLFKYADELRTARDNVLRESNTTAWAVFTYEGQTNVLKLSDSGTDLDDGFQALDASKIMYMYARVIDPNSQLGKYVLINWCGTGAPEVRKAVCATHIPEICRFLTKIHVTMNVRSEDELSVEELQARVSKASGANYNAGAVTQNTKPVTAPRPSNATGYVRPNAAAEIQAANRDKFWEQREKEEEDARKAEEARRKADVQARLAPAKSAKPSFAAGAGASANGSASSNAAASAKPAASLLSERDRFWAEQEAEENRRREEDRRRIEAERQKREAETREREMQATAKREAEARARAEQISARKQYVATAESSKPAASRVNDTIDAARDEDERGKRADAAKQARQQEIQAIMRARNAQSDAPDDEISARAEALRAQRQEEIKKLMSQRNDVGDEEEERRRRTEELRKQREREMQEAFSKRTETADTEEDERRRRADELRRKRQDEMHQTIGASGTVQPSAVASRVQPSLYPQSQPQPQPVAAPTATFQAAAPFRPGPPPAAVTAAFAAPAFESTASNNAPRSYIPPMAKQVLPGLGPSPGPARVPEPAPAPVQAPAPAPAPVQAPVQTQPVVNPLAAAAAAIAPSYTAQGGANINDSPNRASQQFYYKAGSGQATPAGSNSNSPTKTSTYAAPAPTYDEPEDVYQNMPYIVPNASASSGLYVNEQVSRGNGGSPQRSSMQRASDLYEPVSFGAAGGAGAGAGGAKRSSYRNANDEEDDQIDTGRPVSSPPSGLSVRALYDYEANDQDEISFAVDDLITEVQQIDSGWWLGTNPAGKTGMFPANYVAIFTDQ